MVQPRRSTRGSVRLQAPVLEERVFPIGAQAPSRAAVDVGRRLEEVEAKLRETEQDRAADAELIGNLLGEIGERDRRLRALEAQAETDGDRIRALEIADASQLDADERVRALEDALAADQALFGEVLARLSARAGNDTDVPSELRDLLAVTLAALELTRRTTAAHVDTLEQIQLSVRGGPDFEAGLEANLDVGRQADAAVTPVNEAIDRVVAQLRQIEGAEQELARLRGLLLADTTTLVAEVRGLGSALGRAAHPAGSKPPPLRRPKRRK